MDKKNYETYLDSLLEKSEEAYLMALEIVNKPTIQYRTEGFCFFICNAWELLLKAFIIKRSKNIDSIFFKDKSYRTLSLSDCISKVFTSTTDKTKLNLSHIVAIRNRATHSILPEYDYVCAPLFQQCITYYNRFFSKQFPNHICNNSITPFVSINRTSNRSVSPLALIDDAKKFLEDIKTIQAEDGIGQNISFKITKKDDEADARFKIDPNADETVKTIKVPKDINSMYPYTFTSAVQLIQETLELSLGPNHGFSTRSFNLISYNHPIKTDEKFCYTINYGSNIKKYSQLTIDFICDKYFNDTSFRNKYKKKVVKP